MEGNTMKQVGDHPWANDEGRITPESAATCVANWILTAGGKASTAFQCALEIAKDLEARGFSQKAEKALSVSPAGGTEEGGTIEGDS
jgi:hypothetical protein